MNNKIKKIINFPATLISRYSKSFSRKNLYKFLNTSLEKYEFSEASKLISIGSGGAIGELLKNKYSTIVQVDIDPDRKPDLVMSIENMDKFDENSVDAIFCMEVLEHVSNPFLAVKEIERVLKPDGIFIGSTPFLFPLHDEPYDFFRYTKYGIRNLFKNFKEEQLLERNTYYDAIYVLLLRSLRKPGSILQYLVNILLFPFFILFMPILKILGVFFKQNLGCSGYFYIFKKSKK